MEVIILLHVHAFDRIAMAGQLSNEACSRLIRSARSRKRKIGSSHWIMATQFRRFIRQHDRDRYWIFIDWALCARCHTFWTIAHQRWFDVCVRKGAAVAIDIYRSIDHTISCWRFFIIENLPSICATGFCCDESDSSMAYSMANVDAGSSKQQFATIKISVHRWRYMSAMMWEKKEEENIFRQWKSRFQFNHVAHDAHGAPSRTSNRQ